MFESENDKRNFLFFLSDIHPVSLEDTLIGAVAAPSSWEEVARMITAGRGRSAFARTINNVLVYLHVPFCDRICTFCHCSRVLLQKRTEIDQYVRTLRKQMAILAPAYEGMDADSVCFGGGTPSLPDSKQLSDIMDLLDQYFPTKARKIFIEIHPASWTAAKLELMSERGLHRVSIGVQSFDEEVLRKVDRHQTKDKVLWCLHSAQKAGVPIVSVDFIAGLPGQTTAGLVQDIRLIIKEGAKHVYLQPYTNISWDIVCSPGESVVEFLKRRDTMMKEAAEVLIDAGYYRNGLGEYACIEKKDGPYPAPHAALTAFGPYATGEFPGVAFHNTFASRSASSLPGIKAAELDTGYVMSQYALQAIINGLNEDYFLKRFGVTLDAHCGDGLRYLEQQGLAARANGTWKFSGKWEFQRVHEYTALSRVLFGDAMLARLKTHYQKQYFSKHDYSSGNSFLNAYNQNWLMTLYYQERL